MTTVRFMSRAQWGGGPRRAGRPVSGIRGLVIHHTVMGSNRRYSWADAAAYMRNLQRARPDLGGEVPYSFVVFTGFNGSVIVAEGRGANWSGAHTIGYNSSRYGVALPGNLEHEVPSIAQIDGINWIGRRYLGRNGARTMGHYEVSSTACPGSNMRSRIGRVQPPYAGGGTTTPKPTPPPPPPKETFLMALSDNEQRELLAKVRRIPSDEGLGRILVNLLGSEHQGHPVKVGDVTEDARRKLNSLTNPTFISPKNSGRLYVTNWVIKAPVVEGSPHHALLQFVIAAHGGDTSVHQLDPKAVEAIPTVTS